MAVEKIDSSERLLNLTAALLSASRGLTAKEIFLSVPGYGYLPGIKENSAESRLLTRDVADLRKMGIRIPSPEQENDKNYRYKLADGTFEWSPDFHPTATQMRLLEMATHCWQDISLSKELGSALNHLAALGDTPDRAALAELVPNFKPIHAAFGQIVEAIEAKSVVSFEYRKPQVQAESRTLSPWLFISVEGQWLLQGWDMNSNKIRNFMLKRVLSQKVTVEAEQTYRAGTDAELAQAMAELEQLKQDNSVLVKVVPNTAAWSHFEMEFEEGDAKRVHFVDQELMASELRRFANQVEVIEPASMKDAVRAGLERVVAAHA